MDLRSQAVSVLIKEQQNVNKATVILPRLSCCHGERVAYLTGENKLQRLWHV
jgi:hypothetical protein